MRTRLLNSGQSMMEYAVLLTVVVSALIAMQVYIKRGIQGRIRDLADQISTTPYQQGRTIANYNITQSGTLTQEYCNGSSEYQNEETIKRSVYEKTLPDIP